MNGTYSIDEIKAKLAPIFRAEPVRRAVLFGSYARGCATENSDIDIAIETEAHVRGLMFYGILDKMVAALGAKVDMLPMRSIKPDSPIEKEIGETGRVIYERE